MAGMQSLFVAHFKNMKGINMPIKWNVRVRGIVE